MGVVNQEAETHDLIKAAAVRYRVDNEESVSPADLLLDQEGVFLLHTRTHKQTTLSWTDTNIKDVIKEAAT